MSLFKHHDFLKFWSADSISFFGSQFSALAIPWVAVTALGADSSQMGILGAVSLLAFPLFGLFVGVWVDRNLRKRIMIVSNMGRALLLATIPAAAILGGLNMSLLYIVSFLVGTFQAFFDIAYQAYVPSLVERTQLVEANSKLETTRSTAQVAGPSIAGVLVQIVSGALIFGVASLAFYFAAQPFAIPLMAIAQFIIGVTVVLYNVNQVSYRQALVPLEIQGRMNASMRFIVWGTIPVGAILGGVLGQCLGVRPAIGVAAIGSMLAFLWVIVSPVRKIREIPGR